MLKRDIQGKFALKSDDYRQVRSLRLTDKTWKAIGIAAESLGLTRADYLEHIVKYHNLPSITLVNSDFLASTQPENEPQPGIIRNHEFPQTSDSAIASGRVQPIAKQSVELPMVASLEILRDRVLSELKLGKQASRYKTVQKALNSFIAELIGSV
ncbi:hypothetical protein Cylst_6230 [Cylindrospermum stagnale PCC 7417]|uniref:Uncharacterized protein n=1 Tax=Cylindrospermum stagnale PCC 7417 TaxID=56107 RepID=K9X6A2_9NOST|nr:hypothetical protein [Cylindrospermum stagnale]AFZ28190.1 hypothetical protein Cylst_6230 [Cylindrospermum stagnale PCC 7417]